MSASDVAMLQGLVERIDKLEKTVQELVEARQGKELSQELYGEQVNHAEEREARRGPGRPPGVR